MLLDPKIKIIEVSLQGVLHAVVPTAHNNASARLNRALRQIEREYGLKLTFTPDNPGDRVTDLVSIDLKPVKTEKSLNVGCPGYPEHHRCKCHTEIDTGLGDDLPKCQMTKTGKIGISKGIKSGHIYRGESVNWLSITKDDLGHDFHNYHLNCSFCNKHIFSHEMFKETDNGKTPLERFKRIILRGIRSCPQCNISFKWDFDKNIVVMRNERTE